jgi:DNA (cytosine-5)-methyltransferase 1
LGKALDFEDIDQHLTEDTYCPPNYKCPKGVFEELTVEYWFRKNDVENHPNASDYFKPHNGIQRMQNVQEGDVCKKSYKRLHRWRYSPTAAYGNNEVHLHPYKVRRLSAVEAMAIQSLPKEFELPVDMTLTDKFKTIGNGVPFLLSNGIASTINDFLNDYVKAERKVE